MKRFIYFLLPFLFACEQIIELDVDQTPANEIVIQGLVTDSIANNIVLISRTLGLYDKPDFRGVPGGIVIVEEWDSTGTNKINEFPYLEIGGPGQVSGFYVSNDAFGGVAGRIYKLIVQVEGEEYRAQDQLRPVSPMDSLVVKIDEEEKKSRKNDDDLDSVERKRYYQLLLFASEPPETNDYYQWNFYRNGELENHDGLSLYYADDKFLQENISGFPAPIYFALGDTFYVEQLSLSRAGFIYLSDLDRAMNNDGGMFSPPPANPRSNFSNEAFGFFQVSSVDSKYGIIENP